MCAAIDLLKQQEDTYVLQQIRDEVNLGVLDYSSGRYTTVHSEAEHHELMNQLENEVCSESHHEEKIQL